MMRKFFGILTTIMLLTCAAPIMAESVDLLIDGHKIESNLDLEVPAQVVNGVTLVPLRFISESMCANVHYEKPIITITYDNVVLKLTIGEKMVTKNGDAMNDLAVAPLIKDNITLVPLRFIAEAFGADVNYVNGKVTVDTPAVIYDGVKISSLQFYGAMTMGGYLNEAQSNKTIAKTLAKFNLSAENEVQPPKEYTASAGYALDVDCCYLTSSYYTGFDAKGNEIFKYEVYQLLNNYEKLDMPSWLVRDVKTAKWYKYKNSNDNTGFWKQVFNDAA